MRSTFGLDGSEKSEINWEEEEEEGNVTQQPSFPQLRCAGSKQEGKKEGERGRNIPPNLLVTNGKAVLETRYYAPNSKLAQVGSSETRCCCDINFSYSRNSEIILCSTHCPDQHAAYRNCNLPYRSNIVV